MVEENFSALGFALGDDVGIATTDAVNINRIEVNSIMHFFIIITFYLYEIAIPLIT